ncbi:MAG: di-heme enzyme [Bryobacterales bacterium]|nr:di-heme enzyme [Bryobacterales bacterium]
MLLLAAPALAHDAHGRSNAPAEARRLKNPVPAGETTAAQSKYAALCAGCHGEDGRARTKAAGAMAVRPTDLTNYLMESMKDGEIYWVVAHGIGQSMPAFAAQLSEREQWEMVHYVRALRTRRRNEERAQLGPYNWNLPPGFPYPKVPADNLMTQEKVELGRYLFYDRRLSLNQTQSCGTCHEQARAFADARGRGLGSTGQLHPRGPMSLANVAYAPVLTWANPNVRTLEQQALVPMFGDHPVELGMTGKEELLLRRLRADARYRRMFPAAFAGEANPFTVENVTKAIASFERTIFSGDSPYDEYRRGDDPNAISAAAKRGEALFFSETLECFHCHGGFNFTGSVDYLGKGFAEVEFHNTGLYNLKGKTSYPEPNVGLYEFTQQDEDIGKFKAPTLRNIALTAPYMHDGSVLTLEAAIDHYRVGGRTIRTGPRAGVGFDNPNKSEFVKSFELTPADKADLLAFLRSLTDRTLLANPALSDPFQPASVARRATPPPRPKYRLRGEVVKVFAEDGAVTLFHEEVPGFMQAMRPPNAMEFLVPDRAFLATLRPGMKIAAGVRKRGGDYILERLLP